MKVMEPSIHLLLRVIILLLIIIFYNIAQNIIETGTYNKLNEKEHLLEFEDTSIVVILEDDQFSFPVEINDKLLIASFEKVLNVPAYQTFD